MSLPLIALAVAAALALATFALPQYRLRRLARFRFPDHIARRVRSAYPHLSDADCARVMEGLRQFFAVSILAQGRRVAMPSQAVDTAWHEFILSTRAYRDFCRGTLGRFLHHTPAEAMRSPTHAQDGIRRAWRLCCRQEVIDAGRPKRLPLLFAIDADLAIPGGFTYALDCRRARRAGSAHAGASGGGGGEYCAGHIGCSSGGGCSGDGGGDGDGDGGGDGGGCGGD
jgi:hypothetical protein